MEQQTSSNEYFFICISSVFLFLGAPGDITMLQGDITMLQKDIIIGQSIIIALGGIYLMTAFAYLGKKDYRGVPSKVPYRIARYILAVLFLVSAVIQIYVQIAMPGIVHYSPYSTVVDVALIAYLLTFKPSDTTKGKKILKVIGYTMILIAVNALQNTVFNGGAILVSAVVMAIGVILVVFGGKKRYD